MFIAPLSLIAKSFVPSLLKVMSSVWLLIGSPAGFKANFSSLPAFFEEISNAVSKVY